MTKKVKIFIGVASAIGVVSAYYFLIYRKRKPNFDFSEYKFNFITCEHMFIKKKR